MTTYSTGNPIGSTDSRDRLDNSENFDKAINSIDATWDDRLGVTRDTFEGALSKLSFYRVGTFAAGHTLTNMRQTLEYDGHEYSWAGTFPKVVAAGATPATSGGIGTGAWINRTDATLRQELGVVVKRYKTVSDLISDVNLSEGDLVEWDAYYANENGGGNDGVVIPTAIPDAGRFIALSNGLFVESLFTNRKVTINHFGARRGYSYDSTAAIDAAINAFGSSTPLFAECGDYKYSGKQFKIADFGQAISLNPADDGGVVTIKFFDVPSTESCVKIVGLNYSRWNLDGIVFDCNTTGLDGVEINSGDRFKLGCEIKNPQRDALFINCSLDYQWLENADFRILFDSVGRHAVHIVIGGTTATFFNEAVWRQCELRGVSQRYNGGAFICAEITGTWSGSSVTAMKFLECNLDAQRSVSVANGFDISPNPIILRYHPGASNIFDSWDVDTGGWESTSGVSDVRSPYLVLVEDDGAAMGARARGWRISSLVPYGWSGYQPHPRMEDYNYHDKLYGRHLIRNLNSSWIQQDISTGTTVNIDIALPHVQIPCVNTQASRTKVHDSLEINFSYAKYASVVSAFFGLYKTELNLYYGVAGADQYSAFAYELLNANSGYFTVNSVTILNADKTTTLNRANPPAFARLNVTTSSSWGSDGGGITAYLTALIKSSSHNEYHP